MISWTTKRRECVYCGKPIRAGRRERRRGELYPLTCGSCSDLVRRDPLYSEARSVDAYNLDKSVEGGEK